MKFFKKLILFAGGGGVDIPPSQIERGISLTKLFQKHVGSDEPGSLNRDEHGNMLRLSTDQIESIQHEAVINVPSRSYPSRYHVWKLNSLLQTGSVNIKVAFQNIASSSQNISSRGSNRPATYYQVTCLH